MICHYTGTIAIPLIQTWQLQSINSDRLLKTQESVPFDVINIKTIATHLRTPHLK